MRNAFGWSICCILNFLLMNPEVLSWMPYKVLQRASCFQLRQSSSYFSQSEGIFVFLFITAGLGPAAESKQKESIDECRGNTEVQHALIKIQLRVYSWYRYLCSHVCTDPRLLKVVGQQDTNVSLVVICTAMWGAGLKEVAVETRVASTLRKSIHTPLNECRFNS